MSQSLKNQKTNPQDAREHTKYILWVDSINMVSLSKIFFLSLVRRIDEVRFITMTNWGRRFKGSRVSFKNVYTAFEQISPHEEMALTNKAYEDMTPFVYEIASPAFDSSRWDCFIDKRYNRKKINLFLKQELAVEVEVPLRLINLVHFSLKHQEHSVQHENGILFQDNYWVKELKTFAGDSLAEIHTYFNVKEFINLFYVPFKVFVEILLNTLFFVLGRKPKLQGSQKNSTARIAVLHVQGADLTRRADYFWLPGSGIDPQDVLVYFKYHNRPPSSEAVGHMSSLNIPWINLLPYKIGHKKVTGGTAEFNHFPTWTYIQRLIRTLGMSLGMGLVSLGTFRKSSIFIWKHLTALLSNIDFFEAFFEEFQVRAHFALHEGGKDMHAANIAMELVDGVDLCTHWSSYDSVSVMIGRSHDVCFTWGSYFKEKFFSQPFYDFKNFVYTGYPYDSFFEQSRPKALEHRTRLKNVGAQFIVCLFDQNNPPERPLWCREVERIYERLLKMVLDDPAFGLVVKPKKIGPQEKMPRLASLVAEAQASNRCLILPGNVFPNEGSQAADLTIGLVVSSTPTVEAALAGARAITYDPEGNYGHSFYQGGRNRIVFDDLDRLFESVREFRSSPDRCPEFGVYAPFLKDIDPFQDRKSSLRIGAYINQLLTGLKQSLNSQQSIHKANAFYRQAYGINTVEECLRKHDIFSLRNEIIIEELKGASSR